MWDELWEWFEGVLPTTEPDRTLVIAAVSAGVLVLLGLCVCLCCCTCKKYCLGNPYFCCCCICTDCFHVCSCCKRSEGDKPPDATYRKPGGEGKGKRHARYPPRALRQAQTAPLAAPGLGPSASSGCLAARGGSTLPQGERAGQ